MKYSDYQNSRNLAWKLLIDFKISALPIKITKICRCLDIDVKFYAPSDGNSGETQNINGHYTIFINSNDPVPRQRFTIAHELGHILLGHVGNFELVNREPSANDNPIEQAANVFAVRLLAPACVLHELNVQSADDIVRICDISRQAAQYRYERLKILEKRNKFYTSPLEKVVRNQFENYIYNNRL